MNVPNDLKYTRTHEWVRLEGDIATVGITDHAQSELGDIVFVELPTVGRAVQTGDSLGTIESVKTVSDVYAPIAGEVTEVNAALGGQPELINSEAFAGGWLFKLKVSSPDEVAGLLDPEAYGQTL